MRAFGWFWLILVILAPAVRADPEKTAALNALRAAGGLSSLTYSSRLEQAALLHADDMLQARHFSHTGSDGSDVGQRVSRTGYGWCVVAENIAQGHRNLKEVLGAWQDSPGHRANMFSREVTEFAVVEGGGYIWVMVLARPGC